MSFQKDTRTFYEKLEVGNQKEDELVEILSWCGVPAKRNNDGDVKDIDIELTYDDMFVDCKFAETPFLKAKQYVGIDADKCLPINVTHIRAYEKKERDTGKKCWIAFFIDFKKFGVHELVFIPNSQLVHFIKEHPEKIKNGRVSFSKEIGRDMHSFLDYVKQIRKIKGK